MQKPGRAQERPVPGATVLVRVRVGPDGFETLPIRRRKGMLVRPSCHEGLIPVVRQQGIVDVGGLRDVRKGLDRPVGGLGGHATSVVSVCRLKGSAAAQQVVTVSI